MQRLGQSRSVAGRMCRAVQRAAYQSCLRCLHQMHGQAACQPIGLPALVPIPPLGGFLALDWCDGQAVGPLARRSFQLHAELAESLGTDCGYRRVTTHSIAVKQGGAAGRLRVPVGITWCANKPCMPLLL